MNEDARNFSKLETSRDLLDFKLVKWNKKKKLKFEYIYEDLEISFSKYQSPK